MYRTLFVVVASFLMLPGITWSAGNNVSPSRAEIKNSSVRQVSGEIRKQMRAIGKGQSEGRVTKAQAKDLRKRLKLVRKEMRDYMKANGSKTLTPDQVAQLTKQLDSIKALL